MPTPRSIALPLRLSALATRTLCALRHARTTPSFSASRHHRTMSTTDDAKAAGLTARTQLEASVQRNPHPDFKAVEAARPDWDETASFRYTKTRDADWQWGQGANDGGASLAKTHVEIDPHEPGRPVVANYKLLISGMIPRPIGFLSTIALDGSSTNLAPFSYTNMVCHDPPIFAVGITGSAGSTKDSLANILASKECVLNMISEHFVEAANATAVNAPYGVSEWGLTGLHRAPSSVVRSPRIQEAVFAIECTLYSAQEFNSKANPEKVSATMVLLEGVRFWVREDAINAERNLIDPNVLRPVSRLGGITYGRTTEAYEIPRGDFAEFKKAPNAEELLKKAKQ